MALKPDLNSSAANVQNVVVYVSNDNFAQSYAVEQQNVPQQGNVHPTGYPNSNHHTMASVAQTKNFSDKQHIFTSSGQVINASAQGGYFENVITQNGFPLSNIGYHQNGANLKNHSTSSEVLSCDRQQAGPGRPDNVKRDECDNRDRYTDPYVTILGTEVPSQSVRCDSVRSETAESSCSSLSSVDEGMVVVQNHSPEMVVYDPSVSVRPGGVVLVAPPSMPQHAQGNAMVGISPPQFTMIPHGWKRLLSNGSIIYISPSNTALSSLEQVKEYLLSSGTCKCGLECHFKYDTVFNFDPKVIAKPWILSPDTNTGDLTKLCNHKRKIMAMASLDCKPPDLEGKMRKDYGLKKKKRKIGVSLAGGISVSQILAQREKLALEQQQAFNKEVVTSPQQVWPPNNPTSHSHLQGFVDHQQNPALIRCHEPPPGNRMMTISPVVLGEGGGNSAPSQSNVHVPNIHLHAQHVLGPNGQIINIQEVPQHQGQNQIIQGHQNINVLQHQQQQQQQQHNRVYMNTQPSEPSGPGRPNMPMAQQMKGAEMHQAKKMQQQQQQQQQQQSQIFNYEHIDHSKHPRLFGFNGLRPQAMSHQNQLVANNMLQLQQQQQQQQQQQLQQKLQWQHRMQNLNQQQVNQINQMHLQQQQQNLQNNQNVYERVPPLHQHTPNPVWQEEIRRKKVKLGKVVKNRQYHMIENNCQVRGNSAGPCPNIDVRQIPSEHPSSRPIVMQHQHNHNNASSPSFMEDPSGYLAQQTALLNNTISRQTGANNSAGYGCSSSNNNTPIQHNIITISNVVQPNEVPLPSSVNMKSHQVSRLNQNMHVMKHHHHHHQQLLLQKPPQYTTTNHMDQMLQQQQQQQQQQNVADSSVLHDHHQQMQQHFIQQQQQQQCQGCITETAAAFAQSGQTRPKHPSGSSRSDSAPSTPSSCGTSSDDPVTSSMYSDKPSPDTRPIQGGTVSTSNVSPMDSIHSDPPTPNNNPHTPTPPHKIVDNNLPNVSAGGSFSIHNHDGQIVQIVSQSRENYIQQQQQQQQQQNQQEYHHQQAQCKNHSKLDQIYAYTHSSQKSSSERGYITGIVTTMASGRTTGCNTITSVLAGRTNTATVSINNQPGSSNTPSSSSSSSSSPIAVSTQAININVSRSPLEMVQSVVSSIQVPTQSQHHQNITVSIAQTSPHVSPQQQIIKHSPTGLPPGHILVSSNGQLIMASAANVMAPPPPPKVVTSQNASMPPVSVSPMVTNVTAAVSQVIPAVAQQVLGQQTVLVNTLPTPFVIQPGVTMTMEGMTVAGQHVQIPQIVTGNVIHHQQQIHLDNNESRRAPAALLSPETNKKKGKKRKLPSQTVAGMLHIAAQQNSGMVQAAGFPQQIQMTHHHSPQSITTTPVMQALTIVPSKTGGPPQIVMNGQAVANANHHLGTQQIITNSQPTQQINLLQPVSLINGTTGVVQNIPAIQQFIVPTNIGGSMVMNADGTATILQDTSNLGMQLQIQNVNGQNVLTPIQNNNMFNAGMVIRAPTSQGKIIQQQHSPGAQFLSPNGSQFVVNSAQFSGQLSPLIASVSPSHHQQVTFNTSPQQIRPNNQLQSNQQEFIQVNAGQMGQTLMVPCTPQTTNIAAAAASSSANQQNTTYVQQNTTIVQQQTTMVANNHQQLQNFQQQNSQQQGPQNRSASLNVDPQNFLINSSDKNQSMQALLLQHQRNNSGSQEDANYRQSVSTQTAVNQNSQSVTTNTFCQTSTLSASSPPDTTTLSPIASGGQSPPTADTTTHTGSTDDGLSPAPSNCSASCSEINVPGRPGSRTMAMVHCVSSSEPDLLETTTQQPPPDQDWRKVSQSSSLLKEEFIAMKHEFTDITSGHMQYNKKQQNLGHLAYEESTTMLPEIQFLEQKMKQEVLSSKRYGKIMQQQQKRSNDVMLVMDSSHMSLFDDDDETNRQAPAPDHDPGPKPPDFKSGDLVWGPTKGSSAWPGKITQIAGELATIKWFGGEKNLSKIKIGALQTLSEGFDSHHQARKRARTSRKLNTQLEKAIQEAMAELDKSGTEKPPDGGGGEDHARDKVSSSNVKKASRLRSGQR